MSLAAPAAQVLGWPLPSTVCTTLLFPTSARVRSNLLKYLLACCFLRRSGLKGPTQPPRRCGCHVARRTEDEDQGHH